MSTNGRWLNYLEMPRGELLRKIVDQQTEVNRAKGELDMMQSALQVRDTASMTG